MKILLVLMMMVGAVVIAPAPADAQPPKNSMELVPSITLTRDGNDVDDFTHFGAEMDPRTGLLHFTNTTTGLIDIYDATGTYVDSYGSSLVGGRRDSYPADLAFMDDTIYVTYYNAGAVVAYDRETLAAKGGVRSVAGLAGPVGLDATGGLVYVADRESQRVRIYDAQLNFQRAFLPFDNGVCNIAPNDVDVHGDDVFIVGLERGSNPCPTGLWMLENGNGLSKELRIGGMYSIEIRRTGEILATGTQGIDVLNFDGNYIEQMPFGFGAVSIATDPTGDSVWVPRRSNSGIASSMVIGTRERCDNKMPTRLGTPGDDVLGDSTQTDPQVVWTGAGMDVVNTGSGDDSICTGHGNDFIESGAGRDRVFAGSGDDGVDAGLGVDRIWGGHGKDTILGSGGSDRIWGGPGDDVIQAGSGADRVWGGDGNDDLRGQGGQDFMWGEAGNDTMQGNWQSDRLWGGPGNDRVAGAEGKDKLYGGPGDDELYGGVNTDYLNGGPGTDFGNGQKGIDNPLVPDVSGCEELESRVSC